MNELEKNDVVKKYHLRETQMDMWITVDKSGWYQLTNARVTFEESEALDLFNRITVDYPSWNIEVIEHSIEVKYSERVVYSSNLIADKK